MWLNPKSAPPGYYHRAGATAYLIDAAGTYSPAGEPTIDPAGAHGNPGASTPTLAAAGGCILVTGATSAAEIVDPAGSYSLSSAAIDPAGPYSGSGASAPTLADPGAYVPLGGATSSASEIVYPAGAYSGAGVSASTVDPAAGAYSGPEAAPTLAATGTYISITSATCTRAETVDPAGTYGGAGERAPTIVRTMAYSRSGASLPKPAPAGTFIPLSGATSAAEIVDAAGAYSPRAASTPAANQTAMSGDLSASPDALNPEGAPAGYYYKAGATAYVIDPAGTYSLAGATTPTADPAGTYSAVGAGAPTRDPAGTYSSPYALDRLFLETTSATPDNRVLSFNSATAVENYYGVTSVEARQAKEFFTTYRTSANMLVVRFPLLGARAHLYGANVSNLALQKLRAINGSISVISQGYRYSASINLSGITSFSSAAIAIQAALNEKLPVAAVTTGSSIAPMSGSFTGSANGLLLDVTSIASGSIQIGAIISGAKVPANTQIISQVDGTPGGVGLYSLYVPAGIISSETMTESYGVLTVGSVSSATVADGQQVTGAGILPDTAIEANLSGSGAGSTWVVNNALAVASENMTMTAAPLSVLYTAVTGATENSGYFSIQQNGDFSYASASLSYATGTGAVSLGLTHAAGAWLASQGGNITSESAFMNNLVETESDQFGSVQTTWSELAEEDPESQTALEEWAQSTDGQFQFLKNDTSTTPPAGRSTPTTDPGGAYSGPGAGLPTPAQAGTYIPVTGATSSAAETVDPAGTYSGAGASAPITDPAGTYSGPRASAPTLAAAGTYIPGMGTTSAAAEVRDPAGTYSSGGASAPTTDPAGAYSRGGASAPTPAAAGTYIPGMGATSAEAEITDPAGFYSLAGASAPTEAQPGYYVPTADASSETPVSSGYYQPNSGATSELLAQPLTISGAEAGQTTAPLQHDTPFSSVTISDPNTDTSDSLSIQLTGGGGILSDGAGFSGLTTSGPGVYLLSGTAAAITSELDALVFTPSAGSGARTFTLTDTSSAGTSASNANTTVAVESSEAQVVSVPTFLADQSSLDKVASGFNILGYASEIAANLDHLDDPHINSISVLDSAEVGPSVLQLTTDATAIGKLTNANSLPALLAVNDTAQDVEAGLSMLVPHTSKIASITASNGRVVVSAATFLADQSALDKIVGGFGISDTAADVAQDFDALDGDLNIASIALTDEGVPTLSLSLEQAENDARALDEITTPHGIAIADSTPSQITSTEAIYLSGESMSVTGAPVIATGTVATMAILAQIETSLLVSQGYTLAVLDTAANIEGLTLAQINNLSLREVLFLQASDTSVALSANLAVSLEAANMTVTAPSGSEVTLAAPKASVNNLTTATIAGLPALGVSSIVSTNGSVTISVAQALALEAADLGITVPAGDSVSLSDLASNITMLTPGQINGLTAVGVSGIDVSNAANLLLSAADAQALEAGNLEITPQTGYSITVSDTAADVATLSAAQFAGLPAIGVSGISVSDNNNLTLSVAQTTALETVGVSLALQSGYSTFISDSAANIETLTAGQITGLAALDVTGINATDTSVTLTVKRAEALEGAGIPVSAPAGDTVQISDSAAHLENLTANQIDGLAAIGVIGLVSDNANVSYTRTQTAAILASGLNASASGAYTVTEHFANGDYSVYQGGQLIQQKSVNPDGSYDVAVFDVTGETYSAYEDIFNSAGTLLAEARDMTDGSGRLLLFANGVTTTTSSGSESVTTGSDTFAINPHSVETTNATDMQSETFVYGPGFGQDTLIGFLETTTSHDLLQFSASMFGFSSTQSQTADAQTLLSNFASGTTNTLISVPDPQSDTLTINNHAISTFQHNLEDFKFT